MARRVTTGETSKCELNSFFSAVHWHVAVELLGAVRGVEHAWRDAWAVADVPGIRHVEVNNMSTSIRMKPYDYEKTTQL